jgi:O-antigen/teichoic acid export membrane protein
VLLLAGPVSRFYADERLLPLMLVLALNYAVNPFGSITYAWLMREMRFGNLALMRFCSSLAGALVSVVLAWRGHGPISLAWGSLAGTLTNAALATAFRPANYPWMPGLKKLREVLSFGSKMTGSAVLNTVATGAPDFLLGRLQGMEATGLYSRANGMVAMFRGLINDAVLTVAAPHFARIHREGGARETAFLKSLAYMTVVGWTFCGTLAALAEPAVRVLYGPQWTTSAQLVPVLALAVALQIPVGICHALLTGLGMAQQLLRGTLVATAVVVGAVFMGALHSLPVLAWCTVAAFAFNLLLWLRITTRSAALAWPPMLRVARHSLAVALPAMAPAWAVAWAVDGRGLADSLHQLLYAGPLVLLGFVGLCLRTGHPLAEEIHRVGDLLRHKLKGGAA